jgi:hypothetical protein
MKEKHFPPGWNAERVKRVLTHYESQSEDEDLAEDEAALEGGGSTVIKVPSELVPAIREMIARHSAEREPAAPQP